MNDPKPVSEVWGEDLRTSKNRGAAIRGVKELCRRVGIEIKDRPTGGWATRPTETQPLWFWSTEEINGLVDYVEVIAKVRLEVIEAGKVVEAS